MLQALMPELHAKLAWHVLDNDTYVKTGIMAGRFDITEEGGKWN